MLVTLIKSHALHCLIANESSSWRTGTVLSPWSKGDLALVKTCLMTSRTKRQSRSWYLGLMFYDCLLRTAFWLRPYRASLEGPMTERKEKETIRWKGCEFISQHWQSFHAQNLRFRWCLRFLPSFNIFIWSMCCRFHEKWFLSLISHTCSIKEWKFINGFRDDLPMTKVVWVRL